MPIFPPTTLKESVYTVLCFFDLFDYPLTLKEIHRYLLKVEVSEKTLFDFLENESKIGYKGGYYFLHGRERLVEERFSRSMIVRKYWRKVKFYLPFIQFVPFVKMVSVCNTLAFNNPTKDSDIDLFIVTEKGKIFLTRALVTVLFAMLGVRRHGKKIAGRFCLSFFVADNSLNLETIHTDPNDIYLLYWMMTLRPLYGVKTYHDFLAANDWLLGYFPYQFTVNKESFWTENRFLKAWKLFVEFLLNLGFAKILEKWLHKIQLKRHGRNSKKLDGMANVVVNEKMLKFHNIDRRKEFAEKFKRSYERFL